MKATAHEYAQRIQAVLDDALEADDYTAFAAAIGTVVSEFHASLPMSAENQLACLGVFVNDLRDDVRQWQRVIGPQVEATADAPAPPLPELPALGTFTVAEAHQLQVTHYSQQQGSIFGRTFR